MLVQHAPKAPVKPEISKHDKVTDTSISCFEVVPYWNKASSVVNHSTLDLYFILFYLSCIHFSTCMSEEGTICEPHVVARS